jgi:hypothetical protein
LLRGDLQRRVEHAVWVCIGARAGDPLPVQLVVGDVSVDQEIHEVARAFAPVDAKVARQERRDDHAHAVVHPALGAQLPHSRVD